MDLLLEIIQGDRAGHRTQLRDGLVIGRKNSDLTVQDSKISSRHAQVTRRKDGRYWLLDLGSSNGIKVDGQRVTEVLLEPGQVFLLGRTQFKVVSSTPVAKSAEAEIVVEDTPVPTWRNPVRGLIERAYGEGKSQRREIEPFSPPIRFHFLSGIQAGTDWTIGYGPREIGANSVDLPLDEENAPPVCFRLVAREGRALMQIDERARGQVLVNGSPEPNVFLRSGDVIEIRYTRIKVEIESNGET